ncbi:RodZ domain-containing protein [Actinomadura sp. 9N407]|uniref:RodZ domain-containing protein n=1 Tax=Actinomadura sp. 9N407 TaxID=3375154 RepID=UPI0037ACB4BA
MGRHTSARERQGPENHRRTGVHVAVLVALLAGAGATVFAVAGVPPTGGPGRTAVPVPNGARSAPIGRAETLVIAVTGPACDVKVRRADGAVLLKERLPRGRTVRFGDPRLDVELSDASAAKVYVNGSLRPLGPAGKPTNFTAARPKTARP